MAEESAPPPVGGEAEPGKKKLRLKVHPIEENAPRVRRRVITAVPAVPAGVSRMSFIGTAKLCRNGAGEKAMPQV